MRFVTYSNGGGRPRLGVLDADRERIIDLGANGATTDLTTLIQAGADGMRQAAETARKAANCIALADAPLMAPIPRPRRNIMCVGKNYFEHSKEFEKSGFDATSGGAEVPEAPGGLHQGNPQA